MRPTPTIGLELFNSLAVEVDNQGSDLTSSVSNRSDFPELTTSVLGSFAVDCERLGFDSLWCSQDQGVWVSNSHTRYADPSTILASIALETKSLTLGVFEDISQGRHPTMFAREITTLDIVSSGRAGLAVSFLNRRRMSDADADAVISDTFIPNAMHLDNLGSRIKENRGIDLGQLIEYLQICRKMFSDGQASLNGVFYKVPNAVNLPPPAEPGEPFTAWNLGLITSNREGLTEEIALNVSELFDTNHLDDLSRLLKFVDALIVDGSVESIESLRSLLDRRIPSWAGTSKLIWRGELEILNPDLVDRLVEAGVRGFICKITLFDGYEFERAKEAMGPVVTDVNRALA